MYQGSKITRENYKFSKIDIYYKNRLKMNFSNLFLYKTISFILKSITTTLNLLYSH
ncbi:hypothetical protein BN1097_760036 [Clostridioides difficile]|uniref:Uncharacterized protein n=1 Tax=Clostridioides difficile TaxID=1496 RepID=A0A069ANY3_CLODI|nr:hypothetical protein BN1097_760036 [Clostridioides difficile]